MYGLKQAPRAWNQRFSNFICSIGFTTSKSDASLFVYKAGDNMAYLLLYVDDIIVTASSPALLQHVTSRLHSEFAMTDLGDLHHFLGISVTRDSSGCSSPSGSTLLISSSVLACLNAIRQLLLWMPGPSCPPQRAPKLPIPRSTGALLVRSSTSL